MIEFARNSVSRTRSGLSLTIFSVTRSRISRVMKALPGVNQPNARSVSPKRRNQSRTCLRIVNILRACSRPGSDRTSRSVQRFTRMPPSRRFLCGCLRFTWIGRARKRSLSSPLTRRCSAICCWNSTQSGCRPATAVAVESSISGSPWCIRSISTIGGRSQRFISSSRTVFATGLDRLPCAMRMKWRPTCICGGSTRLAGEGRK